MTDDLDALKQAMHAATPRPHAQSRADNIALALENFDKAQGSVTAPRPTPEPKIWTGVIAMLQSLTTKGGLTATTALVAAVFLVTPAGQDIWRAPMTNGLSAPATLDPAPLDPVAVDPVAVDLATEAQIAANPANLEENAPEIQANEAQHDIAEMAELPMFMGDVVKSATPPAPRALAAPRRAQSAAADTRSRLLPPPVDAPLLHANTETFPDATPDTLKITPQDPVSTFSIDVDTASYGVLRSSLNRGQLPPKDAVRIEEMINYFPYDYPAPAVGDAPFLPSLSVMQTPWNPDTQLLHIALQGQKPAVADRPPLNLVFLIDTSGSMSDLTKLPLLRQSFLMMLDQLRPDDEVAIVTYAGSAGLALAPTTADNRTAITAALNGLSAGGSTNGQGGLQQAYAIAGTMAQEGDVSRILLATDGDFNVGLSDPEAMKTFIADKRDSGTFLSVLGFGRGNLNDALMQSLAQNGNGTAAYIDTLNEAQKVLVDQLSGALFTIASDVKVQVEFNPATVAEYRLIGYETRALNREDFNNDAVDAGELGAGHSVTAIFEITPVGSPAILSDPLRYQTAETATADTSELGFLKLRYKAPGAPDSQLMTTPIPLIAAPSDDAYFAAAIAGFGQLLRGNTFLGDWTYTDAIALATQHRGDDPYGYRTQAVQLMRLADSLSR